MEVTFISIDILLLNALLRIQRIIISVQNIRQQQQPNSNLASCAT